MNATQPTLFELPPPSKAEPRRQTRDPFANASTVELSDKFLDYMGRECADCIDENGVSLPWLLRQIRQSGASRVTFI